MPRLHQSLADYVVVALSPALIMGLIGSFVFFLLEVFYHGQYEARLQFIFAMFVMATVLIGRISIEEGASYAALFALPMAIVTGLAIMRFVEFQGNVSPGVHVLINLGLMAAVWFAAHQLTYDCTVVDETLDASGAGLLDRLAWFRRGKTAPSAAASSTPSTQLSLAQRLEALTNRIYAWLERPRKPHALGRWVVYFALVTLPLFGLGQLFISAAETGRRRYIFLLLLIYVASALGLLLTTSFLSLRRYLRQRNLEMPVAMTSAWLGVGAILIVVTLAASALLPRPAAEYEVARLPVVFGSPGQKAHRLGQGPDGTRDAQQPASRTEKSDDGEQTTPGDRQDASDPRSDQQSNQSGDKSDAKASDRSADNSEKNEQQNQQDNTASTDTQTSQPSSSQQPQEPPSQPSSQASRDARSSSGDEKSQSPAQSSDSRTTPPTPPPPSLVLPQTGTDFVRWLVLGLLIAGLAAAAIWHRHAILAALRQFWAEIVAAWQRLLGRYADTAREMSGESPAAPRLRSFHEFADPFLSGEANRLAPDALVAYTFAALVAWGRDHQLPYDAAQTPLEYATLVGKHFPALATEARRLAEMYSVAAYSNSQLSPRSSQQLQTLWQLLRDPLAQPKERFQTRSEHAAH